MEVNMDNLELDKLLLDIQELKRSVRKANPFLRDIMALRAYAILSIPVGIILLAICLITHFLIRAEGSFDAIPRAWKIFIFTLFVAVLVVTSLVKWVFIDRRAAQLRSGANFFTVIRAMYGGRWFSLSVPILLCAFVTSLYFALTGHPWLIVSIISVFIGPLSNMIALVFDRREYLYMGWYMTIAGLASLFFIESMPFVWLAVVWAGTFLVFGAAGLAAGGSEQGERP
jgi:hypothetical protein